MTPCRGILYSGEIVSPMERKMDNWEDRLATNGKIAAYEKAIKSFRKSKKTSNDQHKAYAELTACGLYSEEADEMINLELENSDD